MRVYLLDGSGDARLPDGNEPADGDGSLRLWGHTAAVNGVDYSHDGQLLFSASGDG